MNFLENNKVYSPNNIIGQKEQTHSYYSSCDFNQISIIFARNIATRSKQLFKISYINFLECPGGGKDTLGASRQGSPHCRAGGN
jgi:hypothetical protein